MVSRSAPPKHDPPVPAGRDERPRQPGQPAWNAAEAAAPIPIG
jgi:hypothetical protein